MNTFNTVAGAIANQMSVADIVKTYGIAEARVKSIANSIDDPEEAYREQIAQNFFDKYEE